VKPQCGGLACGPNHEFSICIAFCELDTSQEKQLERQVAKLQYEEAAAMEEKNPSWAAQLRRSRVKDEKELQDEGRLYDEQNKEAGGGAAGQVRPLCGRRAGCARVDAVLALHGLARF
jgi:hypothetical protein